MAKTIKKRGKHNCLSIEYYVIRSKHHAQMFYRCMNTPRRKRGWVKGIKSGSVFTNRVTAERFASRLGSEHAEVLVVHGMLKSYDFIPGFIVKDCVNNKYIARRRHFYNGKIWTDSIKYSMVFLSKRRAEYAMKRAIEIYPELKEVFSIIQVQIFYET